MTAAQELTVREAARHVHRSEETIRRWIWSGRLPATKHGHRYRIDINHLENIAVVYEPEDSGHAGSADGVTGDLAAWFAEVTRWKAGLPTKPGATSADLVIEDRRDRR